MDESTVYEFRVIALNQFGSMTSESIIRKTCKIKISVSPNPVEINGTIKIIPLNNEKIKRIELVPIDSRLQSYIIRNEDDFAIEINVNVSNFNKGIYEVIVTTNDEKTGNATIVIF